MSIYVAYVESLALTALREAAEVNLVCGGVCLFSSSRVSQRSRERLGGNESRGVHSILQLWFYVFLDLG